MKSVSAPQAVEEVNWGLYIWRMPNGQFIADEQYNYLNIASVKGNIKNIQILTDTVRELGIEEGSPVFLAGRRQINDEEFEIQRQRLLFGLVPDEQDVGVYFDGQEYGE